MKFKVGDKVRIKDDLVVEGRYFSSCGRYEDTYVEDMEEFRGKIAKIVCSETDIDGNIYRYRLNIDNEEWNWVDEMLEPVTKP